MAIKQSLENLIMMNRYDKPFHPDIAGNLRELLFEPLETNPDYYKREITRRIKKLIKNHERRIDVDDIRINIVPEQNLLGIDIVYTIIGKPLTVTSNLLLERLR